MKLRKSISLSSQQMAYLLVQCLWWQQSSCAQEGQLWTTHITRMLVSGGFAPGLLFFHYWIYFIFSYLFNGLVTQCRERTKKVYLMFSRRETSYAWSVYKEMGIQYLIVEEQWCLRRSKWVIVMPIINGMEKWTWVLFDWCNSFWTTPRWCLWLHSCQFSFKKWH